MAKSSISQLTTKVSADGSDLLEVAAVDAQAASGYASRKESVDAVGTYLVTQAQYTTALQTTSKTIVGAINEVRLDKNLAPQYDDTATYAEDDVVMYQGGLYKCTTAVSTAEAFDPTKWTRGYASDFFEGGGGTAGLEVSSQVLTTNSIVEVPV